MQPLQTYTYTVRAFDVAGNRSGFSAPVTITTPAGPAEIVDGLIARWAFDENQGDKALDLSGNANTLTLMGDARWTEGKHDSAIDLNGTTAYATRPGNAINGSIPATAGGSQTFTVSAWVRLNNNTGRHYVVVKEGADSVNTGWRFGVVYGKIYLWIGNGSRSTVLGGSQALAANTWYHLVATVEHSGGSSARVRLYVDGVLNASTDAAVAPMAANDSPLEVGRYVGPTSSSYANCRIDDLRIYARLLDADEINSIREIEPPPARPRPAALRGFQ